MKLPKIERTTWSRGLAVVTLLVALVFNSAQIRSGADAQRQAQLATELGLLTQLQDVMSESVYNRVRYTPQFRRLRAGRANGLSRAAYRATAEEAANMDYLAWLFNRDFLTIEDADTLWGPRMVCEYKRAFAPALATPAQDLSELLRFIRARGPHLSRLGSRC